MNPFDIFNPSTTLDPSAFMGDAGAARLMQAAAHFPGGPMAFVFLLFWAPVGPGIPAGVLLARHVGVAPPVTLGLYVISDALAVLLLNPIYSWLRKHGRRNPTINKIGQRVIAAAMIGTGTSKARAESGAVRPAPALFRIATVGFGVDIYTAGILATGLNVPRVTGWAAAIAGDLVWFSVLLGSSMAAASMVDDERVIAVVVIAVTLIVPPLARRFIPALRG